MITVHTDGGSRGNPGPAAWAYVMDINAAGFGYRLEDGGYLGETTNNVAEYQAVVMALQKLAALDIAEATFYLDSKLVVEQMNGNWAVKDSKLMSLYNEALHLTDGKQFKFVHVRRELNKDADRIVNEVLDAEKRKAKGD